MKVNVNFTVEFDAEKYREANSWPGHRLTNKEIRQQIQQSAMDRITYGLGDQDIESDAIHNN